MTNPAFDKPGLCEAPGAPGYDEGMTDIQSRTRQLQALRDELRAAQETGEEAEQTVELDQTRMGRLSRMDALQAQAMSKETGRRRREQLRQVLAALRRIEEGDYGDCEDCGEAISAGRLDANPAARRCIDCASRSEAR